MLHADVNLWKTEGNSELIKGIFDIIATVVYKEV